MPTVMTHAVVGMAAGTLTRFPGRWPFWVASALVPVVADLDVLVLPFGVPLWSMWGHRGISHSLAAAAVLGTVTAALTRRALGVRLVPLALHFALLAASHGVLDALTDGGPGVAFFAPLDDTRSFLPWRPIPVSPLAAHFFSERGWHVFQAELKLVWLPALVVAAIASGIRRRRSREGTHVA
jgi:inner membrane protein